MKKKPLLITILCAVVAIACVAFFVKAKYFRKADTNEIMQFVGNFSTALPQRNMDYRLCQLGAESDNGGDHELLALCWCYHQQIVCPFLVGDNTNKVQVCGINKNWPKTKKLTKFLKLRKFRAYLLVH